MKYPYLETLQTKYPLPPHWGELEVFSESVNIGALTLELVGLCASNGVRGVTGSAAGNASEGLWVRAYFELFERICLLESSASGTSLDFKELSPSGEFVTNATIDEIFPASSAEANWKFSISNGAACHTNWWDAVESAVGELLERDAVLYSWFTNTPPLRREIAESIAEDVEKLKDVYNIQMREFPVHLNLAGYANDFRVMGAFAFPHPGTKAPLVYGFGAKRSLVKASEHAFQECLQRLGFLWGEEWAHEMPNFSATPEYHQEYFLRQNGEAELKDWILPMVNGNSNADATRASELKLFDVTPTEFKNTLVVAKAAATGAVPLVFGRDYAPQLKLFDPESIRSRMVHPVV